MTRIYKIALTVTAAVNAESPAAAEGIGDDIAKEIAAAADDMTLGHLIEGTTVAGVALASVAPSADAFQNALQVYRSPDDKEMSLADQFRVIADRIQEDRPRPRRGLRATFTILLDGDVITEPGGAEDWLAETLRPLLQSHGGLELIDWGYSHESNTRPAPATHLSFVEVAVPSDYVEDDCDINALPHWTNSR